MLIDKLADGILRVLTPIGPRYIKPSLQQRIYLLWIFRNFNVLPQQVLSHRQQRFIQDLCAEHKFVSLPPTNVWAEAPILGTVERSPSMHFVSRVAGGPEVRGAWAIGFGSDGRGSATAVVTQHNFLAV